MAIKKIDEILKLRGLKKDTRNTYEFQAYGNRLAEELGDIKHRSLYIRLAKTTDRNMLEKAREHCLSSEKAITRGKLFMWKLKQLREEKEFKNAGIEEIE
ncbi:MAG TPA: hypothetical protein PKK54_01180 [bacterium]|jgi:Zn-finger domain-containing protein|nr:hypothetical protein [bacterium]